MKRNATKTKRWHVADRKKAIIDCLFEYPKNPFGELSMYTTRLLLKMLVAFTIIKTKNEEMVDGNATGTKVATA
nr:hypothetical protein [Tanacetum cinerariifolium]